MATLFEKIKKLPETPGVYFFKKGRTVLYVGKATSLRNRVRSYFATDIETVRSSLIARMVEEATDIQYVETDSILEALILEVAEIKKRQPKYNTRDKDNKSFNYVVITDEEYPCVFTLRERELVSGTPDALKYSFGPFPHSAQLKEALSIVRKIFPYRGKNDPVHGGRKRGSRLYEQLGLAPKLGEGGLSPREYAQIIKHIVLFFEGKKRKLLETLEREMRKSAREEKFEEAEELKRQIFALQHIQDVSLIRETKVVARNTKSVRIEAYDVAHTSEQDRVGVLTVVVDGEIEKSEYKKFILKTRDAGDIAGLTEIISRRLAHPEWRLPTFIVVDGGVVQMNAVQKVFDEAGVQIPIVAVTKNKKHRAERLQGEKKLIQKHEGAILLANSEAHRFALAFHRKRRGKFLT